MKLTDIVVKTGMVTYGSTVAEVFTECVRGNVAGIPFVDSEGRIVGRFSIRNAVKLTCIPEFRISGTDLLGDHLAAPDGPGAACGEGAGGRRWTASSWTKCCSRIPRRPVSRQRYSWKSTTRVIGSLPMGDRYEGIVTMQGFARRMLEIGES